MSQWHVTIDGKSYGPVSQEELLAWRSEGRFSANDMVWREGMAEWQPFSSITELGGGSVLGAPTPPIAKSSRRLAPHRGTTVLVLGILSFVVCVICGVCAWVMGNSDLREMDAGRMDPAGRSSTQAGKLCGMISVLLSCSVLAIYIIALLVFGAAALSLS